MDESDGENGTRGTNRTDDVAMQREELREESAAADCYEKQCAKALVFGIRSKIAPTISSAPVKKWNHWPSLTALNSATIAGGPQSFAHPAPLKRSPTRIFKAQSPITLERLEATVARDIDVLPCWPRRCGGW
jgi:hypothetical protein